jgi:CBS-domain-containing membrane protein
VDSEGKLVGCLSEDLLLDISDLHTPVRQLTAGAPLSIVRDAHPFEAAQIMMGNRLTTLPVVDRTGTCIGLVVQNDLFELFTTLFATHEPGAILSIEIEPRDFCLSKLTHIFESNDVHVRSIISETPDELDGRILVTVKVDVTHTARLRHMLEHHGYHTVVYGSEDLTEEEFEHRVAEFLHFLDM